MTFPAHSHQHAPAVATGGASAAVTIRNSRSGAETSAPRGQGPRVYYSDGRDVWVGTPRKPVSLPRAVTVTFDGQRAVSLPAPFSVRRKK